MARIRTLLLTFFYCQMRQLIDSGHLFIAQPPLYKVSRGKSEQYLKDERALEDFLIDTGIEEAVLRPATGDERAGPDLRALVDEARTIRSVLQGLHSRYNRQVVEQAAILACSIPKIFGDPPKPLRRRPISPSGSTLSDETERGWQGEFTEGLGFQFERTVRGVKEVAVIDPPLLGSSDTRKLDEFASCRRSIGAPASAPQGRGHSHPRSGRLVRGGDRGRPQGPPLQRYRGWEMNPGQLWETTLDTNARSPCK